jgi:hypothetical protein
MLKKQDLNTKVAKEAMAELSDLANLAPLVFKSSANVNGEYAETLNTKLAKEAKGRDCLNGLPLANLAY